MSNKCPRCQSSVYAAEQVVGPGRKFYHKSCLKCTSCNRRLDSYNLVEHDEQPYCKPCHSKSFGTRDLRHQNHPYASRPRAGTGESTSTVTSNSDVTSPTNSSPPSSPPPQLFRSGSGSQRNLPPLKAPARPLSLLRPNRALSPTSPTFSRAVPGASSRPGSSGNNNNPSPTILGGGGFGHRVISQELDATMDVNVPVATDASPAQGESLASAGQSISEELAADEPLNNGHPLPQIPTNTGRPGNGNIPRTVPLALDVSKHRAGWISGSVDLKTSQDTEKNSEDVTIAPEDTAVENGRVDPVESHSTANSAVSTTSSQSARATSPVRFTTTGTRYGAALSGYLNNKSTALGVQTTGTPRRWGGTTPQCPSCSKSVYFAEQVKAIGKTWHKSCLRCNECRAGLDSSRLRDHDGEPFCMRCYNKLYGPRGGGYALLGKAGG